MIGKANELWMQTLLQKLTLGFLLHEVYLENAHCWKGK